MGQDLVAAEKRKPQFVWTPLRRKVAGMVAEGMSNGQIMEHITQVSIHAIDKWRRRDEFWDYVEELQKQLERHALQYEVSNRLKRVQLYDQLQKDHMKVLGDRGRQAWEDRDMHIDHDLNKDLVAGAETGLVTHQIKTVGSGQNAMIVHEYLPDYQIHKVLIDLHDAADKALGRTAKRTESDSNKNAQVTFTLTIDRPREGLDSDGHIIDIPQQSEGNFALSIKAEEADSDYE